VAEGEEQVKLWVYSAFDTLIQAVLNNDPTIDPKIREALLKDITDLENEMNADQKQSALTRSRTILANQNILVANFAGWMTKIGKGIGMAYGKSLPVVEQTSASLTFSRCHEVDVGVKGGQLGLAKDAKHDTRKDCFR
jgi:hypothetical protein